MPAGFRAALSFLTILPVGTPKGVTAESLGRSVVYFPAVGWVVGALLAALAGGLMQVKAAPLLIAAMLVALHAWLTRGLHLDGLADLIDGLGGGYDRHKRLAIMKDSATGVFGAAGLTLTLLLKTCGLASLIGGRPDFLFLLILTPVVAARWGMAGLAFRSKYPREVGTGHVFVGKITGWRLAVAGLTVLPVLAAGWPALAVAAASQLPALWLRRKAHQAFGGVTGDVLGGACELGEAAGWLAAGLLATAAG